jgi:PAS domain S-box-containing protein
MRCASCGVENPEGMKFCGQCATPLHHHCPQSSGESPRGSALCSQGAISLSAPISRGQPAADELLRLSTAVRMSTDSIVICDLEGKIIDANAATLHMYGVTDKGDLLGKSAFELIIPEDLPHAFAGMEETLEQGFIQNREYRISLKDGRIMPVEMSVALMKDPNGQVVGFVGISRDISARKQMEAELRQAKEAAEAATQAKSEFLATMSHELRTPLSVILGYAELLLEPRGGSLSEVQAHHLLRIYGSARVLVELITGVLDLSRLEAGRLPVEVTAVELPAVVAELKAETQALQEQSGLEFVWEVEGELPLLYTDAGKLKVVLKNLIGNAVKFTKEGCITVAAQAARLGVEITVSDTGRGIPAEALGLIFEPFQQAESALTRSQGGTGLGLYIVRRLLELLGGTVSVESEVGHGSTFRVWVPSESPAAPGLSSETMP